jgi:hypothetical protein
MKNISLIILLLIPFILNAQTLNQKAFDEKRNNEMLIGYCNREGFKMIQSNFDSVYQLEYSLYKPDQATIDQIPGKLKKIRIKVIMGTWCGDSKDWVPRFYKVMDQVGFDEKKLTLICVDHVKKAPVRENLTKLKIDKVPTFIIYKKKRELGRIVEVPSDLIERDILKILSN